MVDLTVDDEAEETELFDTDYTDNPICPHCGHEDAYWAEFCPRNAGDGSSYTDSCPSCDADYKVLMYVSYNFTTTKVEVDKQG